MKLLIWAGIFCALVTCRQNNSADDDAIKAKLAFDDGDYESAIVHSTFAILKDSLYTDMYALRGRSYIEIGSCSEAIQDIQEVYNQSHQIGYLTYVGFCYNEMGEFQKALVVYDSILVADSSLYMAWKGRARAYTGLGQHELAKKDQLKYLNYDSMDFRVWNSLGMNYSALGILDSAKFSYHKSIILDSSQWMAYYNISILYAENGAWDSALNYNLRAMSYTEEYGNLLLRERGKLHFASGQPDSACFFWKESLDDEAIELYTNHCGSR
jgi:tetratricopeptide (TPR) repeat protein